MLLFLFVVALVNSNFLEGSLAMQGVHNMMFAKDRTCFTYVECDDYTQVLYDGRIVGIAVRQAKRTTFGSRDSVPTIWLPDSVGGVVKPTMFLYNPNNNAVYITGREQQNIAVCDAQTGERIYGILTGRGASGLACSETLNKIYYASYSNNTIEVINGTSNSVIKTIQLQGQPDLLIWNSITNEIYYPDLDNDIIGVIDCDSDTVIANIQIGETLIGGSMLFNAASNKIYHPTIDSVVIIDGNTHSIIAKTPTGRVSFYHAINTVDNKIYYINRQDETLTIIDGLGDSLITIMTVGGYPTCIAYNPTMNRVYVGHAVSDDIYVLDGSTNQLITIIPLSESAMGLVYDSLDNRIFVGTTIERATVIDCSTNAIIGYLPTGYWTWSMFWDNTYNQVWVGHPGGGNWPTYEFSGYSGDSLQQVFNTITGFTPYASILNTLTNRLYSAGHDDKYLTILDMNNPTSSIMKELGEGPWDVIDNPIENKIYCVNRWTDTMTIIDGMTDSIIVEVAVDSEPVALAFNHVNNKVYCANLCDASLTVIDGSTNNVLGRIPVGNRPIPVLWNQIDNKIYTGNSGDSTITIIDALADTVLNTVPTGSYPWDMVHNTVNDKIYSANFFSDYVTVIDGATDQVVNTISVYQPYTFAYNSVGNKIYCAFNYRIAVIDGDSDSVITNIPIPERGAPYSMVYNPITNKIFCAYVHTNSYPWQDAIAVIDAESDSILSYFTIDSQRWYYGLGCPIKALVLDSLNNVVYFAHYTSSKISVIDGDIGIQEITYTPSVKPLLKIRPNPSMQSVKIEYSVPRVSDMQLTIYDISGRLVKTYEQKVERPIGTIHWIGHDDSGNKVPSGVYIIRLKTDIHTATEKILFLR